MDFVKAQFDKLICLFVITMFCLGLLHLHGDTGTPEVRELIQFFRESAAAFIGALIGAMRAGTTSTHTTGQETLMRTDAPKALKVTTVDETKKTDG